MSGAGASRCTLLAAAVVLSSVLAGCTSSGHPAAVHNTPTPVAPTTPPTVVTTTLSVPPLTSAPPDTSPDVSSSAPSSAEPTTTSAPPPPQTTCKSLTVRVLPGGASFGEQIAGLDFVNDGPTTCTLVGYATVTLLLNGQVIGRPSEPSSPAKSIRTLRPGQVAESLLHDYTQTCQAPLSDSVRVQVPGRRKTIIRPGMQLRACVLRVDRLTAPE